MRPYNVLWIDDEWEKMDLFKELCKEDHSIILHPYTTQKKGMAELEANLSFYDAVLLDAKMWDESENEQASLVGLRNAKQKLDQLTLKRAIPYFISTGQPDLMSNKMFEDSFGKYYIKDRDDDQLIQDMITAMDSLEVRQIMSIYPNLFRACAQIGLSSDAENRLTSCLCDVHFMRNRIDPDLSKDYPHLRYVIEAIFRTLNKVKIIPDACIKGGKVNLMDCSLYLAGKDTKHSGVRYEWPGVRFIPHYIEKDILSAIVFGNAHAHTPDPDIPALNPEDYEMSKKSNFLLYSIAFGVSHFIIWLADKYDCSESSISKYERKTMPIEKEEDEFIPEQDKDGIWHYQACVLQQKRYSSNTHKITGIRQNNDKAKVKYTYFAFCEEIVSKSDIKVQLS